MYKVNSRFPAHIRSYHYTNRDIVLQNFSHADTQHSRVDAIIGKQKEDEKNPDFSK